MGVERFGKTIQIIGGRPVIVDSGTGQQQFIMERQGAIEIKPQVFEHPEGALESLRILTKSVYASAGLRRSDDYWLEVDSGCSLTPNAAWKKIQAANKDMGGVTYGSVAKEILLEDPGLDLDSDPVKFDTLASSLAVAIRQEIQKNRRNK